MNTSQLESIVAYRNFLEKLDNLTGKAWELYQDKMACKAGCSMCCRGDFRISLIEGLVVKQAFQQLPAEQQAVIEENLKTDNPARCPLLINDQCSIYADRPALCRMFGFPITDGVNMATCELNFTEERNRDFTAEAFDKRAVADALAIISRLFLKETGQPVPDEQALPVFRIQEVLSGENR